MVAMLLFSIMCVPYWSATTDAYAKKDFKWIKNANTILKVIMTFISPYIYNIWIGDKAEVPLSMTALVGIYEFILIVSTRYSFVLNGIGKLKLQLYVTIIMAISYLPLAIFAIRGTDDINMLLIVMCAINLPGLIINAVQYRKVINGTATGIWLK